MKKKKKMSKKCKIILSIVILLVAAIGGFGAYFVAEINKAPATIEDSEAKFKTHLKEAPNDGTLPTDHTPTDVIAYILWKVENTSEFQVVTTGKANASIAVQEISNNRVVKDKKAMVSTISSGMVSLGKQKYYENNKVLIRDYAKLEGVKATWKTDVPECITYDEMVSRYGWLPFQANGYVICDDTILNKEEIKVEVLSDGLYKVAFDLNPDSDYAPFWYRREILTNSSSTILPEFISIHAEFTFDKEYRMIYQDFKESYKVKSMGVEAVTNTDVRDAFTYENIEFDKDSLEFFSKYKDLTPKDFNGEEDIVLKEDVATILISSLQDGNKDLTFDLKIELNEAQSLHGSASLNISDLNNVKVKAKLDDLLDLEFADNNLYAAIGGLKLKGSISDITDLVSLFSFGKDTEASAGSGLELDVNQILSDLNNAKVVEDEYKLIITTTLDIAGIKIDLKASILKADGRYVLQEAYVDVTINDYKIALSLNKQDIQFEAKDYSSYNEIKNLKFIAEFVKGVLDNKAIGLTGSVTYDDLAITVDGDIDFNSLENIKANINVILKYKELELNAVVTYIDDTIYLNFGNVHLEAKLSDILDLVGIEEINTSALNINLNDLIEKLLTINYDSLFERFVLEENSLDLSLNLSELSDTLSKLQLRIINDSNMNVEALYDKLSASITFRDYEEVTLVENEYLLLSDISYIIDDAIAITNSKKINANITAKYNDIDINVDAYVDFNDNDIKAKLVLNALNMDITLYYFNIEKTIYIEFKNFYGKLNITDLMETLNIEMNSISIDDILSILSTLELDKVIAYLTNNEGTTSLGLDLSGLNIDTMGLIDLSTVLDININDTESGFNVKIDNLFNLNIDVLTTFDGSITLNDYVYTDLMGYITLIKDLIDSTKYEINITGIYKDIIIRANGIFDRSDLALSLDLEVLYKTNTFNLNLNYYHEHNNLTDVFYINFMDLHGYITLSDIMDLIPAVDTNISINSILDTLLSADLNKILERLTLTEETIGVGINLSEFNIDTKGIIDLSKTINIELTKITDGIRVDIDELFGLELDLIKTDKNVELEEHEYINLGSYISFVKDMLASNKFDISLTGEYKDIKLAVNGVFDVESLALDLDINAIFKDNSFDINVNYYHENNNLKDVFYVSFKDLHAYITLADIMALIPNTDSSVSIDSILDTLLSKDLNKILEKLTLTDTNIGLGINLSELNIDTMGIIDLNNTINIDLAKIDNGVELTIPELFNLDLTFTKSDKEVVLDDYQYVDLNPYISLITDLVNSTKYELALTGSYKDITLTANGVFDREALSLELALEVTYKTNTFNVNINYFNKKDDLENVFYISFMDLHAYVTLEDIMKLIPDTSSEVSLDSILDTLLSKDLNKILESLTLTDNSIGLGINLSEFNIDTKGLIDLTNTINIELNKIDSGVNVSIADLFGLDLTVTTTDKEVTLADFDYVNLSSYLDLVKELMDSTKYELALSGSYKDITLTANGVFDREVLALDLALEITYKTNTFNININYFNKKDDLANVFYVSFMDLHAYVTLEDIMKLIPDTSSEVSLDSILDTLLSKDLNKLLESLTLSENSIGLGINLSEFNIDTKGLIDLTNTTNIELNKIDNGVNVSIAELFGLDLTVTTTDKEVTLADFDYVNLSSYLDLVKELMESTKYELALTGSYKDITLTANGVFDREALSLELALEVTYKTNTFNVNINYFNKKDDLENVFYVSFMDLHAFVTLEDIMKLIPDTSSEVSLDSILDTLLSKDLNKILESLTLTDNSIGLGINLSEFDIDTKGIIDLTNTINVELNKIDSGVNVSIAELFGLDLTVTTTDKEVSLADYAYVNLASYLDLVKELMDSTKYELALTGSYKDITLIANGVFDREALALDLALEITYKTNTFNININYFNKKDDMENVFYVSFMDLHAFVTLEDIMKLIPDTSSEVSLDSILDTLLSKDLNKILESLTLTENTIGLGINLSDLNIDTKGIIDLTNTINIELAKIEHGVNVSIAELFGLDLTVTTTDKEVALADYEYVNLASYLDLVKELMDSTKYELALSGSYKDINLTANGVFDREALSLELALEVTYKTNTFNVNINYFNKKDDMENVFYVSFKNLHAYVTLEDIMKLIPNADSNVTLDSILDTLLSKDLNKILESLTLTEDTIGLGINLSDLNIDTKNLIDLTNTINIELSKINSGVHVSIAELFGLDLTVTTTDKEVALADYNYISLSSLLDKVASIINLVNKKSFRLNVDASLNISNIVSLLSKDIKITGYVDFLYDESYIINANLAIKYDNINASINVKYAEKYIYIDMLGLNIKLLVDDLMSLVEDVMTKFEVDDSNLNVDNSELLDKVFDVIDTLSLVDENSISVDLSTLFDKLSIITVTLLENNNKYSLDLDMDILDCTVSLDEIDYYDLSFDGDYLEYDDILNLCEIVKVILDLTKEKNFNINLDFTVYDDGYKHLDVEGNIKFIIYENGRFDLEFGGTIIEYNDNGTVKMTHMVDGILISKEGFEARGINKTEDYLYLTYGTNPNNKSSKIKLYTKLDSVLSIVSTLSKVLGLDLSFLDGYSTFSFNDIDTSQVTNLFSSVTNEIDLGNIINSFNLTENRLEATININDILSQPEGSLISLLLDVNKTDSKIANLSVKNIYTVNDATKRTRFDIEDVVLLNSEASISVPSVDSSWYDISGLDNLVDALLVTASNKEFAINGTVRMKVLSLLNIDVPLDARVHVDDDGKPIIYAHLDLSDIGLGRLLVDARHVYIYYENEYVYLYSKRSSDYYQIKISYEEFLSDIVYYLLDFGMGLSDTILSAIEESESSSDLVDAGKVLNNYYSSNNDTKFYFSLDLGELLGNSNLGDIEAELGLRKVVVSEDDEEIKLAYALTDLNSFNVNLVSVIDLTLKNGLTLSNVSQSSDGYYRFTSVDLSQLRSYIDSYNYDVDMIYKNGKESGRRNHSVTFYTSGYGIDNSMVSGPSGSVFTYPTFDYITYNGEIYVLEGWYTNKGLTSKSDITTIQDSNIVLYAKFVKGYKLTLNVGNETYSFYYAKGSNIENRLSKVYTVKLDDKYYISTSYSLDGNLYTDTVMPEADLTLTANLQEIQYRLFIDNDLYKEFDPDDDLGLSGSYSVLYDGVYYNYSNNNLTSNVLLDRYMSNLVIDGAYGNFYIETYTSSKDGYYTVNLDYSDKFVNNWYFGVSIPNDVTPSYSIFNFGSYNSYGINYWYNDTNEYYEGNISEIEHVNQTLYAYYYTNKYLEYGIKNGKATISAFNYNGSQIDVILPKYVKIGDSYYILATMENISTSDEMASAFTSNTSTKSIYFNDGFETIIGNAFKGCTNLTKVYFSDTITSVATDSFYMNDNETAAKNIRFYLTSNFTLSHDNWLGVKVKPIFVSYEIHYGKKESNGTFGSKLDLTSAFQSYSNLHGLIHNMF